jgi:hypothetical protein
MTNSFRGEVPLQVGETTYTLRFSANALCELEDALGMGINKIAAQMADPETMRMKTVMTVVWAGLRDRHPDITLAQAGEILTDASLSRAMEAVSKAFILTFGSPAEEGQEAFPLKPGHKGPAKSNSSGTGKVS